MQKLERDLRAQTEDDEKRQRVEKYKGENILHTTAPVNHTHTRHAFLHKQSHTPTHSPYCQVALMDAYPTESLCM